MIAIIIFFVSIIFDLLFQTSSDIRYFLIIGLWIFFIKINKYRSDVTFKLALGLLAVLTVCFIVARDALITERIAIWLYLLLLVGAVQQLLELKREKIIK